MRRSQALVILLLATTFAAGVAGGVAADRLWLRPEGAVAGSADEDRSHRKEAGEEKDDDEEDTVIERFSEELELTATQEARIDTILRHYRQSMRGLRREVRPRYEALVDSARRRIEAVLDTPQARKYRKLLERKEARHGDDDGKKDEDRGSGERGGGTRDL